MEVYGDECLQILREHFNIKIMCSKMMPRILTPEQKETRMNKTFLAKHKIPKLEHAPFSPDLAPCDFFLLFPNFKSALKGTRFKSVGSVKEKATEVINYQKRTYSIASNSREFAWSCLGVREETTLKVITFTFCD
ncbi:hypothetical protein B7P43_G03846 [Cryptotermes secundus]|uniref:Uncharacterized protein n=1 Tax=Cryptotermes secundus TaxID=105785 RepID=A0A2J7QJY0_9NEOP|nr:hypothetical protein B7P43_G03846 [Cryptotermes secundus]